MAIVFISLCHDRYHNRQLLESGHFGHCQNAALSGNLALPVFRSERGPQGGLAALQAVKRGRKSA
jgi:hypothetical protein